MPLVQTDRLMEELAKIFANPDEIGWFVPACFRKNQNPLTLLPSGCVHSIDRAARPLTNAMKCNGM